MRKGNEGKCFGKWDMRDPACSKCLVYVRARCEETTRRKRVSKGEDDQAAEADGGNQANEYFLKLLEGRLDRRVEWGEPIVKNVFSKDGRNEVFVAQNLSDGRLNVKTRKWERVLVLESVEQAEKLAKEILG